MQPFSDFCDYIGESSYTNIGGTMEDGKIIELFYLRDQAAIAETDKKYGRYCRRVSYNILSNREDTEECVSDASDPQGEAEAKELAAAIDRHLKKLSPSDRSIFVSRYWLMEPLADIAGATGYSISRVKSSLHRSREKLKKQLRKEGLI